MVVSGARLPKIGLKVGVMEPGAALRGGLANVVAGGTRVPE